MLVSNTSGMAEGIVTGRRITTFLISTLAVCSLVLPMLPDVLFTGLSEIAASFMKNNLFLTLLDKAVKTPRPDLAVFQIIFSYFCFICAIPFAVIRMRETKIRIEPGEGALRIFLKGVSFVAVFILVEYVIVFSDPSENQVHGKAHIASTLIMSSNICFGIYSWIVTLISIGALISAPRILIAIFQRN